MSVDVPDFELAVSDELRPRVSRKLGLPLEWDSAIDALTPPRLTSAGAFFALACRLYRKIRSRSVGDRCAFEPSCSRYSELCFVTFGTRNGLSLTVRRLIRCSGCNGGLDLPPGFQCITDISEKQRV
ncbi:membrane protein insertion efficiency factor YidD [Rhizobium sp.]|uniref:membrane protein insertion efficiency factor YidD n=1 Tax=Rhizobium sp. TaxID=391 RepID=UPI0034C5D1A6